MALDDISESDIGFAVAASAVTAAIFSPRTREALHRGAVYGLAGILRAGDAIAAFSRGVGRGAKEAGVAVVGPVDERDGRRPRRGAKRRRAAKADERETNE
jgi:hypothetical protein